MKASVKAAFVAFSTRFEGAVPWMYLDVKGLVTTGIGNLIDPCGLALGLPWVHPGGLAATQQEIVNAWRNVKSHQELAPFGGASKSFSVLSDLRLTQSGIETLVFQKAAANEAILKNRFPDFDTWPADAQLGLHSLAWACGPGFHFPKFEAAAKALNFEVCAVECQMDVTGNPGLKPRNKANAALFRNAALVLRYGLDSETLYYPGTPNQPGC